MAVAGLRSKESARCWSVESLFACIVLTACACSVFIAHMSSTRSRHTHHRRNNHIEFDTKSVERALKHSTRTRGNGAQSQQKKLKLTQPQFKRYIIENPDLCKDKKIDILIYFHSEVSHYDTRVMLRKTWANTENFKSVRVKTVFFLGDAAHPEDGPGVLMEQGVHGDIVQGDFLDIFSNLSVKAIMASHWISSYCSNARYVIKADDDVFVDIFRIVELLIPQVLNSHTTIMCHYHNNGSREIQREPKGRWYVPEALLPEKHFPQFCSGYFVLMTSDVLPVLFKGSRKAPLISVDDAFLFGLSAKQVKGLKFLDISKNLTFQSDTLMQQYRSGKPITLLASITKEKHEQATLFDSSVTHSTDWVTLHASRMILKRKEKPGRSLR